MQRMSLTHRETSSKHADLFLTHPSHCHGKGNNFGPLYGQTQRGRQEMGQSEDRSQLQTDNL